VTLIGRDGSELIRAEDVAQWAGTINYEILARLSPDMPRSMKNLRPEMSAVMRNRLERPGLMLLFFLTTAIPLSAATHYTGAEFDGQPVAKTQLRGQLKPLVEPTQGRDSYPSALVVPEIPLLEALRSNPLLGA